MANKQKPLRKFRKGQVVYYRFGAWAPIRVRILSYEPYDVGRRLYFINAKFLDEHLSFQGCVLHDVGSVVTVPEHYVGENYES